MCKLREINNFDYAEPRSFDTEELELQFDDIMKMILEHSVNYIVRPNLETKKDVMMYK